MTIRIPDGNTFRIRLTARNLITGEYTEAADLHSINNLVINYVRRGVRFAQTFTIDDEGRAIIVNQGTLDCGLYGIELTGYYGGEPFRFYGKDMFEITDDTVDVSDPSDIIDIEITIKLNTSGVSKAYVDYAIGNVNRDMAAMGDALRDEISEAEHVDDVKVNGVSVVSQKEANITVPTKVSDLQNDSEFTNKSYVDAGISGKQDVINDLATIRSGAAAGGTAYQKPGTGIPASDLSSEVQDMIENGGKTKSVSVNGGTPVTPDENGQVDLTIEQANVTIGTVTTGAAGSNAEVHNSGTGTAPVLDFVIPKGDDGRVGPQGPKGDSAVYNPDDPDTPDFVMANTTGQSTTKAMTQKAITDEFGKTISMVSQKLEEEYILDGRSISDEKKWISWQDVVTKLYPVHEGDMIVIRPQNGLKAIYSWLTDDTNCSGDTTKNASIPTGYDARYSSEADVVVTVPSSVKILAVRADNNESLHEPLVYKVIFNGDIKYAPFKECKISDIEAKAISINANGKWDHINPSKYDSRTTVIPVSAGWRCRIVSQASNPSYYSLLDSLANIDVDYAAADISEGCALRTILEAASEAIITIPNGCNYIAIRSEDAYIPTLYISKPVNEMPFGSEEIIGNEVYFDSYERVEGTGIGADGKWSDASIAKSIFVPVHVGDTLTITGGENGAYYAMLTAKGFTKKTYVSTWASGWSSRAVLQPYGKAEVTVPEDARYLWVLAESDRGNILPQSIKSAMGVYGTCQGAVVGLQSQINAMKGTQSESTYFDDSDITSPCLIDKPLIYEADDKVENNHICNAVVYPNGVIIAARSGGSLVKIALDGTEAELLSLPNSTDFRGLWMDSNLNVYASPYNSVNQEGSRIDIGNGIYRLPYGSDTFTKVLVLPAGYTIWTFCEDNSGYIYAGTYNLVDYNPQLYRSADGGVTWSLVFDFVTSGVVPEGRHVHSVIFNQYNNALYTIIGEVNEVYKSVDHGETWTALGVHFLEKGSSMLATPYGILVGSDGGYFCDIDMIYPNDISHKRVSRAWANTIFAIRQSDISNNIYAFCKIDSSVKNRNLWPQMADVDDEEALQAWIDSNPSQLARWQVYHDAMEDVYPDDAVRTQHFMILMSPDFGKTWRVIYREKAGAINADGFWTTGYFRNGEIITGRVKSTSSSSRSYIKPLVISEGRHKVTANGIDCDGDIFVRTNNSTIVTPL